MLTHWNVLAAQELDQASVESWAGPAGESMRQQVSVGTKRQATTCRYSAFREDSCRAAFDGGGRLYVHPVAACAHHLWFAPSMIRPVSMRVALWRAQISRQYGHTPHCTARSHKVRQGRQHRTQALQQQRMRSGPAAAAHEEGLHTKPSAGMRHHCSATLEEAPWCGRHGGRVPPRLCPANCC